MKAETGGAEHDDTRTNKRKYSVIPRGRKYELQAVADMLGESLDEFIDKAIDERIKRIPWEDIKIHAKEKGTILSIYIVHLMEDER